MPLDPPCPTPFVCNRFADLQHADPLRTIWISRFTRTMSTTESTDRPDKAAGHEANLRAFARSLPDHEHRSSPAGGVSTEIRPAEALVGGPRPGWSNERRAGSTAVLIAMRL